MVTYDGVKELPVQFLLFLNLTLRFAQKPCSGADHSAPLYCSPLRSGVMELLAQFFPLLIEPCASRKNLVTV